MTEIQNLTINKNYQLLTTLDASVSVAKNFSNYQKAQKNAELMIKLRFICQSGNTAVERHAVKG